MSGRCAEYPVVLEPGYRNWSAYVPDLPVCVATGRTRAAVKRSIREAMAFHVEGLQDENLPIPPPGSSTATVQVHVPSEGGTSETAKQYLVVIEPEGDRWSAYAPDVYECATTGSTRLEAEHNMRQALTDCLAEMQARGEPIPLPGRRTALIEVEVPSKGPVSEPSRREAR